MSLPPAVSCTMCNRWETDEDLRIMEFDQSCLVLNRDQFFPGYCLLFTRQHATELFHLEQKARQELMEEVSRVSAVLSSLFKADKINYELLGNMVPHIHWHLVPRFRHDPLWPRPVWAAPHQELLLTDEEYRQRTAAIRQALEAV